MAVAAGKSSVCVYKFCLILLDLLCDSEGEMKVLLQRIQAGITHRCGKMATAWKPRFLISFPFSFLEDWEKYV